MVVIAVEMREPEEVVIINNNISENCIEDVVENSDTYAD